MNLLQKNNFASNLNPNLKNVKKADTQTKEETKEDESSQYGDYGLRKKLSTLKQKVKKQLNEKISSQIAAKNNYKKQKKYRVLKDISNFINNKKNSY